MQYPLDELRSLVLSRQWDEVIKSCQFNEHLLSDREKIYHIRALYELRRFHDCIEFCEKFDSLSEKYTRSLRVYRLRSLNGLGEEEKSKRFAEEMTQEEPPIDEAYIFLTRHYISSNDLINAKKWCSNLLAQSRTHHEGLRLYARIIDKTSRDHSED